jgi:5'(3')-deoxyribonucleotidase
MTKAYPYLKPEQIFSPLQNEDFWYNVKPNYQAIYYIKKLISEGHKILVCTASKYTTLKAKFDNCLFRYFDYLTYRDIIICHDKSLIACDVIIDDYWENIKNSKAIKVLKKVPYNKDADPDFEVNDWKEIYDIIHNLEFRSNCEKES